MALLLRVSFLTTALLSLVVSSSSANVLRAAARDAPLIDVKTSRVYVLVDKKRLGHPHGAEGRLKSGELTLGATSNAGVFVFDMASFKADTEIARKFVGLKGETDEKTQKSVSDNMLGPNVLDVENFPTATFKIESAKATGKQSESNHPLYELQGTFTLHGTTRPLTVAAEVIDSKESTRIRGQFNILQTDYGMTPYSTGLGAIGVADELKIWGEIDLNPVMPKPNKKP